MFGINWRKSLEILFIETLQLKDLAPHNEENSAGHTQWQKVTYTDHAQGEPQQQKERPEHVPVMVLDPHRPLSSCASIMMIYPSAAALVHHKLQPYGRGVESMVL